MVIASSASRHLSVSQVRVTSGVVEENIAQDLLDLGALEELVVREDSDHVLLDLAAQLRVAEVLVPGRVLGLGQRVVDGQVYAGVLQTLRRVELIHQKLKHKFRISINIKNKKTAVLCCEDNIITL